MEKKIIGVIGGMGPESTAIFYQHLIKQCQMLYGAHYDQDYPEILIYNLPIPDVVERLDQPDLSINKIVEASEKLISIGAEFLVMPCNTAHYFYPDVVGKIPVPFVCIFLATAKYIKASGYKRIGFLSTETTINYQSFGDDFERNGIELIYPERRDQLALTEIIMNILGGKKLETDRDKLINICKRLEFSGAEGVVLACTDLPILLEQKDVDIKIFDTVDILAQATIQYSLSQIGEEILE